MLYPRKMAALLQLIKNGEEDAAGPRGGCDIDENDEVLISGFGERGHSVGDIAGVRFKVAKVAGVSLLTIQRRKEKARS